MPSEKARRRITVSLSLWACGLTGLKPGDSVRSLDTTLRVLLVMQIKWHSSRLTPYFTVRDTLILQCLIEALRPEERQLRAHPCCPLLLRQLNAAHGLCYSGIPSFCRNQGACLQGGIPIVILEKEQPHRCSGIEDPPNVFLSVLWQQRLLGCFEDWNWGLRVWWLHTILPVQCSSLPDSVICMMPGISPSLNVGDHCVHDPIS